MKTYSQFIAKSRYARYLEEEKRREDWSESVQRYMDFMVNHLEREIGHVVDTPTQTAALEEGRYVYDVEITASDSTVTRPIQGTVTVRPNVTR